MTDSVAASASSMEALSGQYHAIAHNLANANTTGYKRILTAFMMGGSPAAAASPGPAGGARPVVGKEFIDFSQGGLIRTERPLDLALSGKGFFVLETPRGELYTRNGTFLTNGAGQLVDSSGRTVAGEGGPLMVPKGGAAALKVASDGRLRAGESEIGRLRIVEFDDPQVLVPVGGGALRASGRAAPAAARATTVQQGYLENSNVNLVDELVGLITVTRLYEANVKTVQVQDERTKSLLQVAMG